MTSLPDLPPLSFMTNYNAKGRELRVRRCDRAASEHCTNKFWLIEVRVGGDYWWFEGRLPPDVAHSHCLAGWLLQMARCRKIFDRLAERHLRGLVSFNSVGVTRQRIDRVHKNACEKAEQWFVYIQTLRIAQRKEKVT